MARIINLKKTPGEIAKEQNLKASVELLKDLNSYEENIHTGIKEKGISLSQELAILRKAVKKILDNLGIVDEEFEEYNKIAEEVKVQVKDEEMSHTSK